MVPVRYLGVDRSRVLALKAYREELLAIQNAYRPFLDDFKSVHAVILALDAMAEKLTR
jgi:hypothetical protein